LDFGEQISHLKLELENAIERAVVLGSSDWIPPEDLSEDFLELESEINDASTYHDALRERKKELIRQGRLRNKRKLC
jgi:DNA-binding NtrC family response regulator